MDIYSSIVENKKEGKKQFALLIDPDKLNKDDLIIRINYAKDSKVDYIFLGGSLLTDDSVNMAISIIKDICSIPIVIFPGNYVQINDGADGIFFLSLISGRNPEFLIGQHVVAAPMLKKSKLEIIPTGYMLIENGKITTVQYISNTIPIPYDKPDVASSTAMAGELLGLKVMYLDAGSGAQKPISPDMVKKVSKSVSAPIIIGGGIKTPDQAKDICIAGADVVVVGNSAEKDPSLIKSIADAIHSV